MKICNVPGCQSPVHGRDLCNKHRQRLAKIGSVHLPDTKPTPVCFVDGCVLTVIAKGLFSLHYQRFRKYGTPEKPVHEKPICKINGCARRVNTTTLGLCNMHRLRLERTGTTESLRVNMREKIIQHMRKWKEDTGNFPTSYQFCKVGSISFTAIRSSFGTWEHAIAAAFPAQGIDPKQVIIHGKIELYKDKAPFTRSGKSILGAIEYNTASDTMKCHECGKYVPSLGHHVHKHGMRAREYKIKHGLLIKTALVSESCRTRLSEVSQILRSEGPVAGESNYCRNMSSGQRKMASQNGVETRSQTIHERLNSRRSCRLQTLKVLMELQKELGHTPTVCDLKDHGISYHTLQYHFGTLASAIRIAGLPENKRGNGYRHGAYHSEQLLTRLRVFAYNQKRLPTFSDVRRGLVLCSVDTYIRIFGSFGNAIHSAFTEKEIAKDVYWSKRIGFSRAVSA